MSASATSTTSFRATSMSFWPDESATKYPPHALKHASKRTAGEWPGGPAPLGYRLDPANKTLVVVPAEKKLVRQAVKKFLAGESSLTVSRWLSAESGRRWTPSNCLKLLTSPTLAGQRDDGSKAKWSAVIWTRPTMRRCWRCAVPVEGQARPHRALQVVGRHALPRSHWVRPLGSCRCSVAKPDGSVRSRWWLRECLVQRRGGDRGLLDRLAEMLDSAEFREALSDAMSEAPEVAAAAQAVAALQHSSGHLRMHSALVTSTSTPTVEWPARQG